MSTANGTVAFSTIDHFACSRRLFPAITEAGVTHSGTNTSNHSAIYAKLAVGNIDLSAEKIEASKRIDWSKATEEAKYAYQARLSDQLNNIATPDCVLCTNTHCTDHVEDIERYTMDVLETISTVAGDTLPMSGGGGGTAGHKQAKPGW